mgnify:CR=1 FL=1
MWADLSGVALAWVAADNRGVHQDFRIADPHGGTPAAALPLPPTQPFAQDLYPAAHDDLHLLWLDAAAPGDQRLYSALITRSAEVKRGPVQVSNQPTWRYSAASGALGSLMIVASGGLAAEPALFAYFLDAAGRPRLAGEDPLVPDADWPALLAGSSGQLVLCWLRAADQAAWCAPFANGQIGTPRQVAPALRLVRGDRLTGFSAAADSSHLYLFWNLTRSGGAAETWYTASPSDLWDAAPPRRLGITVMNDGYETGFNTGGAQAAEPGDSWARWSAPLAWALDPLPVAAQIGETLGLIYFHNGRPTGYQTVVEAARLIDAPALAADRERFLYLAWAQPGEEAADLLLVTRKLLAFNP